MTDGEDLRLVAVGGPGATACYGDGTGGLCPCGNNGAPGEGCQNSTGVGALLTATGSNQVVNDDVVFHLSQARPNKTAVFLQGATTINNAFMDGILCTGNPTERLEFIFLDGAGQGSTSVSIVTEGMVSAGQTRTYQGWFRDGMGPCGTGSNLTNSIVVSWTP